MRSTRGLAQRVELADTPQMRSVVIVSLAPQGSGKMKDQAQADRLIEIGHKYLEKNNLDRLRNVVGKLWNLLPARVVEQVSAGLLVPYRPMFLFDAQKDGCAKFPLHSITFGPTLEPARARSAIGLLLNHLESDSSRIKLLRSDVIIREAGFPLR